MECSRILFKWEDIMCFKADFQSMKEGEMIMTSAMDAWSSYLNFNEVLKSPTSPNRLFCYTETTVSLNNYSIFFEIRLLLKSTKFFGLIFSVVQLGTLNGFTEASIEKKYNTFAENLDHIFATYKSKIGDYDLVIIFSVCTVID